jgi:fructose-specific component phosphotransferase system IIB-like protein
MRFATAMSVALLLALTGPPAAAQDRAPPGDLANLKTMLLQLKVNPYPPPRERSAQLLVALIRRMDVSTIDRATIDEIAGLLEDNSDAVRGRMAIALGNIGEPAKHTVPALEKAFARAKDYVAAAQNSPQPAIGYRNFGLGTSADSICFALAKLEASVPPGCVEGRYEPSPPATPPTAN